MIAFGLIMVSLSDVMMQDGDRFWRMPECYIRGNTIKYLRVPDEVNLKTLGSFSNAYKHSRLLHF